MPLIFESVIAKGYTPREGVSPFYLTVDGRYLSEPYELPEARLSGATIWAHGTIRDVLRVSGVMESEERETFEQHVIGKEVYFYVVPGIMVPSDQLYLTEDSWAILRDAGILPREYKVKVEIAKLVIENPITREKKEIDVYPYREVKAGTA